MPTQDVPDLSEFESANSVNRATCTFSDLDLDDERRVRLEAACASRHIQHAAIARVLKSWGVHVSPQTIGRHRSGECSCARP